MTEVDLINIVAAVGRDQSRQWITEYLIGATQEIYPAVLSPYFIGMTFIEASMIIHRDFQATLFGVGIPNKSYYRKMQRQNPTGDEGEQNCFTAADFDLHINPPNYILQGGELVFIISNDSNNAFELSRYNDKHKKFNRSSNAHWYDSLLRPSSRRRVVHRQAEQEPLLPRFEGSHTNLPHTNPSDFSRMRTILDKRRKTMKSQWKSSPLIVRDKIKRADILPTELFGDLPGDTMRPGHAIDSEISSDSDSDNELSVYATNKTSSSKVSLQDTKFVGRILQQAMGMSSNETEDVTYSGSSNTSRYPQKLDAKTGQHVLLCDASPTFPGNVEYLIAPLRSPHLLTDINNFAFVPIVILTMAEPTEQQKRVLERFEEVYVICGNPMSRRDLHRAGVQRCRKAVVLANSSKGNR